jgi:dihydroneopterin aldolase
LQQTAGDHSLEWIEINGLELTARIGVSEGERRKAQRLQLSARFQLSSSFRDLNDQFDRTIDYSHVAGEIEKTVGSTRAHLIETLVSEIGDALMNQFPIQRIELELKKFVLSNASYVSVRLEREKGRSRN